ncbi:hypothetical protein [Bradyrhizobium sp.]|uniref:hypothetical protein n=1 Tax=Bradyrhizobium sp. TaxID=376 RepID=UPI0025BB8517|nr:hypothetical protein [Bradyrhizobium sp.]
MKSGLKVCAGLIAAALCVGPSKLLHAETTGVCVYGSKSYSEGASICLRRSLMQRCRLEGGRMVWTIVAEQDVNRLCSSPAVARFHRKPVRAISRATLPLAQPAAAVAKCFQFNGRTYCE